MSEKEQPEPMVPDSALSEVSEMIAGINAPEQELDDQLASLDTEEDEIGVELQEELEEHSEEADQAIEEEPVLEEQEEEEKQPVEEVADQDTLEKAVSALKRDGLPSSVIDKMTDSEIIELGLKRAKVQGDTDNAYRELSEIKKAKETATESETESSANAEPTDQPVPANVQDAIKPFAEIFGDEAAEALRDYGKQSMAPLIETIQAQSQMLEKVMLDATRGELLNRFPQLSDNDAYARVSTRMQSLSKTGEYQDFNALMSDAARIEFSEESAKVSNEISNKRARQKASGQMSKATRSQPPEHSMSDDEREELLLDALEDGMSMNEARRLYGSAQS